MEACYQKKTNILGYHHLLTLACKLAIEIHCSEIKMRVAHGRERKDDRSLGRAKTVLNSELERGMPPGLRV